MPHFNYFNYFIIILLLCLILYFCYMIYTYIHRFVILTGMFNQFLLSINLTGLLFSCISLLYIKYYIITIHYVIYDYVYHHIFCYLIYIYIYRFMKLTGILNQWHSWITSTGDFNSTGLLFYCVLLLLSLNYFFCYMIYIYI